MAPNLDVIVGRWTDNLNVVYDHPASCAVHEGDIVIPSICGYRLGSTIDGLNARLLKVGPLLLFNLEL